MKTIEFEPASGARIKTASGEVLTLMEASEWNGLSELVDNRGRKLIVAFPGGRRGMALDGAPRLGELTVISGTPELIAELAFSMAKECNPFPQPEPERRMPAPMEDMFFMTEDEARRRRRKDLLAVAAMFGASFLTAVLLGAL